jgi:hypothetical protein
MYRVTVLRPAALMQRPGYEPESLIATQRRPVAKKKKQFHVLLCCGVFAGLVDTFCGHEQGLAYVCNTCSVARAAQ